MPKGTWLRSLIVTTQKLGTSRLVWQRYENTDGTALTLDRDVTGAGRGAHYWACSSPERRMIIILRFVFFFFSLVCPFCPFVII